jgi:DNA-binding NarL/FixJ family response regulator
MVLSFASDLDRFADVIRGQAPSGTWENLSPREREVLALVAQGLSNRQIGRRLFIAEATVKVHMGHILEKLGVGSRTSAALRVPQHARVTPPPAPEPQPPETR